MNLLLCYENPVLVTGSSGAGKSLIINKLLEKMVKPGSTQLTEETILGQVNHFALSFIVFFSFYQFPSLKKV